MCAENKDSLKSAVEFSEKTKLRELIWACISKWWENNKSNEELDTDSIDRRFTLIVDEIRDQLCDKYRSESILPFEDLKHIVYDAIWDHMDELYGDDSGMNRGKAERILQGGISLRIAREHNREIIEAIRSKSRKEEEKTKNILFYLYCFSYGRSDLEGFASKYNYRIAKNDDEIIRMDKEGGIFIRKKNWYNQTPRIVAEAIVEVLQLSKF